MLKHLVPVINYDDDRVRQHIDPIRTEIVSEVYKGMAEKIYTLNLYIAQNNKFRPHELQRVCNEFDALYNILNSTEKGLFIWLTSDIMQRFYHIGYLVNLFDGNWNYNDVSDALRRLNVCFNWPLIKSLESKICVEDESVRMFVNNQDELYECFYNDFINNVIEEFVAKLNSERSSENRNNQRDYRTCPKCGTVFQKYKSRNMHYPKCNGEYRGYVIAKPPRGERNSDW